MSEEDHNMVAACVCSESVLWTTSTVSNGGPRDGLVRTQQGLEQCAINKNICEYKLGKQICMCATRVHAVQKI